MNNECFDVEVPLELNKVDMGRNGERNGPISSYGAYNEETVKRIMKSWEVIDSYLINPTSSGRVPKITSSSGPRYMLLFKDNVWRYASFHGLNGPPWYHCQFKGEHKYNDNCPTGEIAHLRQTLKGSLAHLGYLCDQVNQVREDITELEEKIKGLLK